VTYIVEIVPAAQRQIKKLTPPIQAQIIQKLEELRLDPRSPDVKKMMGEDNTYRVRMGAYRIVYEIYDGLLLVIVVQIGHRREVYRKK